MAKRTTLASTATLFLALGDKTRLRLLNLLRDREVCVSSFTGILGDSQPKISRHLAYLRNAGVVEVRRDGKWMHYRLSDQLDENTRKLFAELFIWMEAQEGLDRDREKYEKKFGSAKVETKVEPVEKVLKIQERTPRQPRVRQEPIPVEVPTAEPEPEWEPYRQARHNELEDFLL